MTTTPGAPVREPYDARTAVTRPELAPRFQAPPEVRGESDHDDHDDDIY